MARSAPEILAATGCWINSAGFKIPQKESGQYITLLLNSDPTNDISDLRVFFENMGRYKMYGVTRTPRVPLEIRENRKGPNFYTAPYLCQGQGRAYNQWRQAEGVRVHYQQWFIGNENISLSSDWWDGKNKWAEGPYVSQIIVQGFDDSNVIKLKNNKWLLHIPAPALPLMEMNEDIHVGTRLDNDNTFLGNWRILLDYSNLYGTDVAVPPSPDESGGGTGRARIPPVCNPLYADNISPPSGVPPSKGNGTQLYMDDVCVERVQYVLTQKTKHREVWVRKHYSLSPIGAGVDWLEAEEVIGGISYYGRTGAYAGEKKSTKIIDSKTHGHGTSLGVMYFSPSSTVAKPTGTFRDWVHQHWAEEPDKGFWSYSVKGQKCRVTLNGIVEEGSSTLAPLQLLLETEITDRAGLKRLFYVPWNAKDRSIATGINITNTSLKQQLGTNFLEMHSPILQMFDPYSRGYNENFVNIETQDEIVPAPLVPPFNPRAPEFSTPDKRTFTMVYVTKCCKGNKLSGGSRPPGASLKYLKDLEIYNVVPSRASVVLEDPIRIDGSFVKYAEMKDLGNNDYEILIKDELPSDTYTPSGTGGKPIPRITIGTQLGDESLPDQFNDVDVLVGHPETVLDRIDAFQAGGVTDLDFSQGTSLSGKLPYLPFIESDDPEMEVPVQLRVATQLRHWTKSLIYEGLLTVSSNPDDQLETAGITPSTIANRFGSKFKVNGVLGSINQIYLVPSNTPGPTYRIDLQYKQFAQPVPGGVECTLPANITDEAGVFGNRSLSIANITGLHDLTIVSSLGTSTAESALTLVTSAGPKISQVEPGDLFLGQEVMVRSEIPGDIKASNVWSIRLSGKTVFEEGILSNPSVGVCPEDLVEDGEITGITFIIPDDNSFLSSTPFDLEISTLVNEFDVPLQANDVPTKTTRSTYLDAFTVSEPEIEPPITSPSFRFIIGDDPTGIYHPSSIEAGEGSLITEQQKLKAFPDGPPANTMLVSTYGEFAYNRNSAGVDKTIDNEVIELSYARGEALNIENSRNLSSLQGSAKIEAFLQPLNNHANQGTSILYDSRQPGVNIGGYENAPVFSEPTPKIVCAITNSSKLSHINSNTPAFIREDLLIIPDEDVDPFGRNYSYLAGFNLHTIPEGYDLIIQNVNNGEKFALQRLVNRNLSRDPDGELTRNGNWINLPTKDIPPGYFAIHTTGYHLAMNLTSVFKSNKLIRDAIIYFAPSSDVNTTVIGHQGKYNGYGGSTGDTLLDRILTGHITGIIGSKSHVDNPSLPNIWDNTSIIPGRGRYILIVHDSLVTSYLYPGLVKLNTARRVSGKDYAPDKISISARTEASTKELPSIRLPIWP